MRGEDARRDPRRAMRAYRRWLTRKRQARRRVGRARDLTKRVLPRRRKRSCRSWYEYNSVGKELGKNHRREK
jgi:hypothetical protein